MNDPRMSEYVTPLMQQFAAVKAQYPDCLILFRLGDFYELFAEDAQIGAPLLDITLTRKAQSRGGDVPMAGIPYHAVESYLSKLVAAGYKVAICEQTTPPNAGKLVERAVVRIVTPGTNMHENAVPTKQNSYTLALEYDQKKIAFCWGDVTTGELLISEYPRQNLASQVQNELARWQPVEVILPPHLYHDPDCQSLLHNMTPVSVTNYQEWATIARRAKSKLCDHFGPAVWHQLDLDNWPLAVRTAAVLLAYWQYTQQGQIQHVTTLRSYQPDSDVSLDRSTMANLELWQTLRDGHTAGSLIQVIDATSTPMGGRRLRLWLRQPSRQIDMLNQRLDAITALVTYDAARRKLRTTLRQIGDVERVISRLSVGIGNARDLVRLRDSLQAILTVRTQIQALHTPALSAMTDKLPSSFTTLADYLAQWIVDEPPFDPRQGGVIRSGQNITLDQWRDQVQHAQDWLNKMEQEERLATGIPNLKIRSNKVFGFYIEVSRSHLEKIPTHYQRKQTLVNGERYITPQLKELELQLLSAEEKSQTLEYELYQAVVAQVLQFTRELQVASDLIANLDCLAGLAEVAVTNHYVRPTLNTSGELQITNGRHPVVECSLSTTDFVPNDTYLDQNTQQMMIITGPNMAGKSVYIRQVALIVLLAHIGSYVPAESAHIPMVDRIFVRSGAADIITSGLSTFMVEMVETAYILHHATPHSLVIMDEIGRGTSTYDGISIAWAVAEALATRPRYRCKTLFATHYHELQQLADLHPHIHNWQAAVGEEKGQPVFWHRIVPGSASHSYGVAVAQMAGIPTAVANRAWQKLHELERTTTTTLDQNDYVTELKQLNLDHLTPVQALDWLHDQQHKLLTHHEK